MAIAADRLAAQRRHKNRPTPAATYANPAMKLNQRTNGTMLPAAALLSAGPNKVVPPTAMVTSPKINATAAAATGSRLGLRAGDGIRLGDAFDALLVGSANDACLALAEHAAGSADRFVERMNAKAVALGLAALSNLVAAA